MQPDRHAIRDAIDNKYRYAGIESVTSQIGKYRPVGYQVRWVPKCVLHNGELKSFRACKKGCKPEVPIIEAVGLKHKCGHLHIQISNMTEENRQRLKDCPVIFKENKSNAFHMLHCLVMDMETCSLRETLGRFMVHAIAWLHLKTHGTQQIIAQAESELESSGVVLGSNSEMAEARGNKK